MGAARGAGGLAAPHPAPGPPALAPRGAARREANPAALDRDAAGLGEEVVALAHAHDERVDRAHRLEGAVQPLDPALLRLERAGFLEELVDHDAQVLAAELRAGDGRAAGCLTEN